MPEIKKIPLPITTSRNPFSSYLFGVTADSTSPIQMLECLFQKLETRKQETNESVLRPVLPHAGLSTIKTADWNSFWCFGHMLSESWLNHPTPN